MWPLIVTVLSGFAGYLTKTLFARLAASVVIMAIGAGLVSSTLDLAVTRLQGIPADILWFALRSGMGEAVGMIGGALVLKATLNAYSLRPSSAVTGG